MSRQKKESEIRLSTLESTVLRLMIAKGASRECYGLELVEQSKGYLKKGSIYVTLGRMEGKGYLVSRKEGQQPNARGLPRRLYKITAFGQRVCEANERQQFSLTESWA